MLVLLTVLLAVCGLAVFRIAFGAGDGNTSSGPRTSTDASAIAGATSLRSTPDFAWVAAKGADRYRVEFMRGGRVVHTATTNVPRLHVAAATLPPGRYRWRVWALDTSGSRVGHRIVDASLTVR